MIKRFSQVLIFVSLLGLLGSAKAQSVVDGSTPLALSPGAPAGSYSLSDFDSVNLYNGNLSFALPIVKIAGRGGAAYTMTARIERKWLVDKEVNPGHPNIYTPTPDWWTIDGFQPIYSMGRMDVRQAGSVDFSIVNPCGYVHNQTLTRLTFTSPEGTEYELRDQATNGQPKAPTSACTFNRGRVFVTSDGSSATFTSDSDIEDWVYASEDAPNFPPSGMLVLRDGTHFRIDSGRVSWMRDRNGNNLTFAYDNNQYLTGITDSLNRKVTISYGNPGGYDEIKLNGFRGAWRTIKVYTSSLSTALRSDFTLQTYQQLFPELNGAYSVSANGPVISAIELPNGQQYHFYYNSYAELARVVLPTGGAIEYDYAAGLTDGAASGELGAADGNKHVYRRVVERRVYPDGSSGAGYASRMTYSRPESTIANAGYVTTDQYNSAGALLTRSVHYFYGSPRASFGQQPTQYAGWEDGREYQTVDYAQDGTTPLRQVTRTFAQRTAVSWWTGTAPQEPPNDPRLIESDTSLLDTNQVSKQTFGYDDSVPYNNQNNVKEYDFGSGGAGSLLRETRTTFVTSSSYTNAGLLSLPSQVSIYDGSGVERARTSFEYDNYTADLVHASLVPRSTIAGQCDGTPQTCTGETNNFNSSSYATRGNATGTTHYLLNTSGTVTGSISSYAQYDIAGNVVKTIDGRGYATTLDYRDNFGAPADAVESSGNPLNTAPSELGTSSAYAFPFAATNALGQTAYTKFDYYLGRPVTSEDINSIVSRGYYDDALDRPSQMIRAVNGGTDTKSQTTFAYDDTNHVITTTSDQALYGDNALKSKVLYDAMGRTTEKRQYESATNYISVQTQYDVLGRAYKTSNPFRPWQSEIALWTTTAFDDLGRVKTVTTPDSAIVTTAYSGGRVMVIDQTGKKRISVSDGLGRLKEVWEVMAADSATEAVTFPNYSDVQAGYVTRYGYDTLDNLTSVTQQVGTTGTIQNRTFVYDSLKRLSSAANPESGTINYSYDNNGNLLSKTDARSITTTYGYDALNRVYSRSYSDGTPTVTYNYDPVIANGKGRLSSVSSSVSAYTFGNYDALGRVKAASQTLGSQTYTMSYGYDLAGHVTSMTYPSGHTVSNSFDSAGRLTDFSGYLGDGTLRTYATGIIYSPMGGMTKEQFGTTSPIYNKLFYNSRGQLSEIREGTSYTGPTDTGWERGAIINHYSDSCWGMCGGSQSTTSMTDNNGNLKTQQHWIQDGNGNVTAIFQQQYDYDSLNRLQKVSDDRTNPTWRQQYSYDRYGNRTVDQTNTFGTGIPRPNFDLETGTNRLYAPGDLALTDSSRAMRYDAAGNLWKDTYSGSAVTRTYDAENRMTQETQASSYAAGVYSYDGDGWRVKRKLGGVETWQVIGIGGELIAEYAANTAASSPQKEYGYRNGQLLITATVTSGSAGTAFTFTDDPLVAGTTAVKAIHLTELRTAVNQARAHAGLTAATWTDDPTTINVTTIKAVHITELRTKLDDARTALGLSPATYTDATLATGDPIRAVDFQELRTKTNEALTVVTGAGVDVRWLVADQLGTPRMIFDQSGSLATTSRHDYLPFGEELSAGTGGRTQSQGYSQADGVRQQFTGQQRDNETSLDYFNARYYSSTQGRFSSADPLYVELRRLSDPQQLNLYGYCRNNPLRYSDPTGLDITITGDDAEKLKDDFNNRKKAQFKITLDNNGVAQVVDKDKIDVKKLSKSERALFDAITDPDHHATIEGTGKDDRIEIGAFGPDIGKPAGTNVVDTSDMGLLRGVNKTLAGQALSHEMLEAYESAKTGSTDYKPNHAAASKFYPEPTFTEFSSLPGEKGQAIRTGYTAVWTWSGFDPVRVTYKFRTPQPIPKVSQGQPSADMIKMEKQ